MNTKEVILFSSPRYVWLQNEMGTGLSVHRRSHQVFKVKIFCLYKCMQTGVLLINGFIDDAQWKTDACLN